MNTLITGSKPRLLVVDDEADVIYSFRRVFEKSDYEVLEAGTGEQALVVAAAESPDVILMDVRMPGAGGLESLKALHRRDARVPVILMTAFASAHGAAEAARAGAFDYVMKPFDIDRLRSVVRTAVQASMEMRRPVVVDDVLGPVGAGATENSGLEAADRIIVRSPAMRELLRQVQKVAVGTGSVLITGEPGTGKALVARALYQLSDRKAELFSTVDCAAMGPTELESALFGQRQGSFRGAGVDQLGSLEVCVGGTLFLKRVDASPEAVLQKLARFVASGDHDRGAGVRIVASAAAKQKSGDSSPAFQRFLEALRPTEISTKPLRERREDILPLAQYFVARSFHDSPDQNLDALPKLTDDARTALESYSFGGNVSQLRDIIRAALLRSAAGVITFADLQLDFSQTATAGAHGSQTSSETSTAGQLADEAIFDMLFNEIARRQPLPEGFDAFDVVERKLIVRALEHASGNQSRASRFLGITRNTLRKRIQKYGLQIAQTVTDPGRQV